MEPGRERALQALIEQAEAGNFYISPMENPVKGYTVLVQIGAVGVGLDPIRDCFCFFGPNREAMGFGQRVSDRKEKRLIRKFLRVIRIDDVEFNDWHRMVRAPLSLPDPLPAPEAFF